MRRPAPLAKDTNAPESSDCVPRFWTLLVGVESDLFEDQIGLYGRIYERYPLDYAIGSIHFLDSLSVMKPKNLKMAEEEHRLATAKRYAQLLRLGIESGWVQIIGHIDGFKRGYGRFGKLLSPYIDGLLQRLAEKGVAMEVNTNGLHHACREWYPSTDVIERAVFHGVNLTFGSDAHDPGRIAEGWEQVRRTLIAAGCKRCVIFRRRQAHYIDLN